MSSFAQSLTLAQVTLPGEYKKWRVTGTNGSFMTLHSFPHCTN